MANEAQKFEENGYVEDIGVEEESEPNQGALPDLNFDDGTSQNR